MGWWGMKKLIWIFKSLKNIGMTREKIQEVVNQENFLGKLKAVSKEKLFFNSNDRAMLSTFRTQRLQFWTPNGKILIELSARIDKMIQKLFGIPLSKIKHKDEVEDMYNAINEKYWKYSNEELPNLDQILATLNFVAVLS